MGKKLLISALLATIASIAGVLAVLTTPSTLIHAEGLDQTTAYPIVNTVGPAVVSTVVPTVLITPITTQASTAAPTSMSTAVPTVLITPITTRTPAATVPPIPNTGGLQYVVQPGDSLSAIAVKYNITLQALLAANTQIANPNLIYPGQVVNIPPGVPNTGGTPTPVPTTGGFYYVVQAGNTLFSIARNYGLTVNAIMAANPQITNANLIFPGQVIFIPNGSSGPGVPPTGGGGTYVVQPGDTLFRIATRYNTTVNAILAVNPQILNANLIFPGQVITLPGSGPGVPPTGGLTYIVQPGDTLGGIAALYGVSLQALLAANPQITNANFILPGQVITIPGATIPPTGGNTYTVVAGDTLWSIALTHGTTIQVLLSKNPQITNPNLIFIGQVINLP